MASGGVCGRWGFGIGLLTGVVLSWLYVRLGYQPHSVVRFPSQVTSAAISMTVESELYNWDVTPLVRQRAAGVLLAQNPDLFLELDDATGNALTRELLRRKAERLARLAKTRFEAYDKALARPALRKALERKHGAGDDESLKRRMLIQDIRDETFLHGYLRQTFPDATEEERAEMVLDVYRNELREEGGGMKDEG